jgi:hypothetical protein
MPFVLDASVAACWAFEDEDHPTATLALGPIRSDQARVPSLWWFEVRNTLIINERRGRAGRGRYCRLPARAFPARGDR